jgi:hypothetical protein
VNVADAENVTDGVNVADGVNVVDAVNVADAVKVGVGDKDREDESDDVTVRVCVTDDVREKLVDPVDETEVLLELEKVYEAGYRSISHTKPCASVLD